MTTRLSPRHILIDGGGDDIGLAASQVSVIARAAAPYWIVGDT